MVQETTIIELRKEERERERAANRIYVNMGATWGKRMWGSHPFRWNLVARLWVRVTVLSLPDRKGRKFKWGLDTSYIDDLIWCKNCSKFGDYFSNKYLIKKDKNITAIVI